MRSIKINVVPRDGTSKVPLAVAGNAVAGIQSLLTHIGEYLVMKELRLQNGVPERISDMFDLYMDQSEGVSMRSSVKVSTSGIIDESIELLERTLVSMGSGAGGYWLDDSFASPFYRKAVACDLLNLADILSRKGEYCMRFAADSTFDNVDAERLIGYIENMEMCIDDATCGIIRRVNSKSGREGLRLDNGDRIRMTFLTQELENDASMLDGRGAIVAGRIRYADGKIAEITDVGRVVAMDTMKYRRMVSPDGDLSLNTPLDIGIRLEDGRWTLYNDDLGISVTKDTWDDSIAAFHDYFIFLWNEYSGKDDESLSEEEREIKEFMISRVTADPDDV